MRSFFYLFLFLFGGALFASDYQITFQQPASDQYELNFQLTNYRIQTVQKDGATYSQIIFGSSVYLNKKGYAQLPFVHGTVQIPDLKNMDVNIDQADYQEISLDYPLLPSRGTIYRNENPDTIPYRIAPESVTDSWYPERVAQGTQPFILRDVRGMTVYFYPFLYNASKQTLRVFRTIKVTLKENDANPVNPLIRAPGAKILPEMNAVYRSVFMNYTEASQNLDYGQHGDLLVITTDRDTAAIQPYLDWKREKGFKVKIDIVDKGTNVKDLIQQEYDADNNLLYVQLVGDYDDVKSDIGTSGNQPMDPQLGCVVGNDVYADIAVGRFSANSSDQVTVQVNKVVNYEKLPQNAVDWYKSALGIGSDQGSGSGDDGEMDKDHIQNIWDNKLDPFTYDIYSTAYDPGATSQMVTDAVNAGVSIINYCGHGSMTSWGTTGFDNNDVNNLTNGNMLPFIFSVACVNGEFDDGECFAEAWLHKDGGGAVMFLGSTISQPWDPPMRGQDYFNDVLIGGYNYDDHPGQNGINTHEQRTFIGSIVINGFALMLNESSTTDDKETVQTWTTFGDPSMQLRTAAPAELILSNMNITIDEPFTTTVTSNGQPVKNAMVCISQATEGYFSGLTDENGQVTIDHSLKEGDALLVVTAFNKETVYDTVQVGAGNGPHIVVDSYSVNDSENGNNNGVADNGETFNLDVAAKNIGNETGVDVQGVLSTTDSYLHLIDTVYYYGNMDSGDVVPGPKAFLLTAIDGVPDQHSATCTVTFSDTSSKTWTSDLSFTINAPNLTNGDLSIDDSETGDNDQTLDAGETATFIIPAINNGHNPAPATTAQLTSDNSYITIQNTSFDAGDLAVGDTVLCTFTVTASSDAPDGELAHFYFNETSGAYSHADTFDVNIGGIPVFLMQNGTFYITNGYFYDSGGQNANYGTGEDLTMTFYPENRGAAVKVTFNSFETYANYDKLYVYDGPDNTYPQVSGSPFSGSNSPGTIEATNDDGALTFHFTSNPYLTKSGWDATLSVTGVSKVNGNPTRTIRTFCLLPSFPNPFNPSTHIHYQLPQRAEVQLAVYDILGRKVRTLVNRIQSKGDYRILWDGKDDAGHGLASGIYFINLKAGKFNAKQKILLVK